MKLKYQMRGLGIGIIVTAILMGVTTGHGIPLTDAEIMARASELGMVDSNSLKLTDVGGITSLPESKDGADEPDSGENGPESPEEPGAEERVPESSGEPDSGESAPGSSGESGTGEGVPGDSGESGSADGNVEGNSDSESENRETGSEDTADGESAETGSSHVIRNGDMVTVEIETGMDSYSISVILEEAGLVESALEFDDFLCNQSYSRKIVSGSYEIPMGASQEEIAKIITRNR